MNDRRGQNDKASALLKFTLQRRSIRRMGVNELAAVVGGDDASSACCLNQCDTDRAMGGDGTFCKQQCAP
jgi:hypothetical protein